MQKMTELSELEVIKKIKSPTSRSEYNLACSIILNKYNNLIKKQWYTLCSQVNNANWTNSYKEDFYSLSYEAVIKAATRTNINRVKDNFLLVQMASWYVSNVRAELIKKILKTEPRKESLYMPSNCDDSTASEKYIVKPYIEQAYFDSIGYLDQPDYKYFEILEEENCERSINKCLNKWNSIEREVFEYLYNGKSKVEIAKLLNIPKAKIYYLSNKMKKDLSNEIEKGKMSM